MLSIRSHLESFVNTRDSQGPAERGGTFRTGHLVGLMPSASRIVLRADAGSLRQQWCVQPGYYRSKSSTSSPAFDAHIRTITEIPALVIDDHGCYFLRRKRNFLVSANFDDAALARDNLIETPAVLELDRDYLISDTRLPTLFQTIETRLRNWI